MSLRQADAHFGRTMSVRVPIVLFAALGFIATLLFEGYHRHAELVEAVELRAEHLREKIDKRTTVLELFVELARDSQSDEHLREQARQITKSIGGWLVIAKPGHMMDVEFHSLGEGTLPPAVPRHVAYAPLAGAELTASLTGRPALSDIFLGRKSGVPTVSIVAEADLRQGIRYVYLSFSIDELVEGLSWGASPEVGFQLIDGRGKVAAPKPNLEDHLHAVLTHRLSHFSHRVRVFETWSLQGEEHVLGTESVLMASLVSALLGLLARLVLSITHRADPTRAWTARRFPGMADGPDRDTREQLGLVLTLGHELRSPLISLLSAIDLVKRGPNETATAFLDHATQEAHGLLRLIDDMLACAKISADGIAVNEEIYSPSDLIATCVKTVGVSVGEDVHIDIERCDFDGPLVGDHAKIRQILLNFLSNAVKFSDGKSVSVGCRAMSEADDRVTLRFFVTDSGKGIPRNRQSDIFFRVGADKSKSNPSSNGLGLMTARLLAEAIGGCVGFDSEEARGSTFWLEVTQVKLKAQASGKCELQNYQLPSGLAVLLAEDDPIIRMMITHDLERAGAWVESVATGEEAIEAMVFDNFDVLITDIRMDGMSGYDVAAKVRTTMDDPPILVGISAHYSIAEDVAPSGLFDLIMEKPFSIATFATHIADLAALRLVADQDEAQMQKIGDAFGDRKDVLVAEVAQSLEDGFAICLKSEDLNEIGRTAHRLAGLLLTFGARALGRKLLRIETMCGDGRVDEVRKTVLEARDDVSKLLDSLAARSA